MPIYTNDPCDDGFFPVEPSLRSSIGIGPKVTKAINAATKDWLDEHPEATTTVEDNSLTNAKFMDGSVNSRVIENESITTDDIHDLAVTTPKIADNAVTAVKIASAAADGLRIMSTTQLGVAKVGAGLAMNGQALELDGSGDIATAVTSWLNAHPEATTTVQDGAVITTKLADGAVTNTKLASEVLNKFASLRHEATIDGWINNTGKFIENSDYARSDYIEFAGDFLYCDDIYNGSSTRTFGFYDKYKRMLSIGGTSVDGGLLIDSIPEGAVYVVVSGRKTDAGGNEKKPAIYCQDSLGYKLGNTTTDVMSLSEQIADVKSLHGVLSINGYINANGGYDDTSANSMHTDFMLVRGYDKFKATVSINSSGCAIAFYDSDKNFLPDSKVLGITGLRTYEVDVPSDATYAIVSYYSNNNTYPGFEAVAYNEETLESRIEAVESSIPSISNPQLLVFGDSITDNMHIVVDVDSIETTEYSYRTVDNSYVDAGGNTVTYNMWPRLIKNKINFSEVRNYARSGASYKTMQRESGEERRNLEFQVQLAINDASDPRDVFGRTLNPDMVIFALGTNDSTPNDTPSMAYQKRVLMSDGFTVDVDATLAALDKTKFCEAAMWAFLTVKKQWPFAQGYVVLPIQRAINDVNGGNLHDYLKEIANKFGYIVIDGYSDSGITRELNIASNLGVYLKDGLHPNEKGQNMMARMIVAAINSHYVSFDGMNS